MQRFQLNPTLQLQYVRLLDEAGAHWQAVRFLPQRRVP
ncbi:hypothetical protein XHV734_2725 [Xanthomonas hortorum pv. vitians]|nr:hypothetical protein XHV734_2725 [Xanthomonas hortorum pv. vitians]